MLNFGGVSHVRPACLPVSLDDITRAMKCGEREKLQEVSSLNFWIWKIMQYPWKHMEWVVFLRAFFCPQISFRSFRNHHPPLDSVTSSCLSDTIFLLSWSCWVQSSRPAPGSSEEVSSVWHKNKWLAKSSELVPYRLYHDCISMVSCFFLFSCLWIQDSQKLTPHPSSPTFF